MSSLLLQPERTVPAVAALPAAAQAAGVGGGKRAPMRRVAPAAIVRRPAAELNSRRGIRLIASRAATLAANAPAASASSPAIINGPPRSVAAVTRAALAFFLSLKPTGATDDRHAKLRP